MSSRVNSKVCVCVCVLRIETNHAGYIVQTVSTFRMSDQKVERIGLWQRFTCRSYKTIYKTRAIRYLKPQPRRNKPPC